MSINLSCTKLSKSYEEHRESIRAVTSLVSSHEESNSLLASSSFFRYINLHFSCSGTSDLEMETPTFQAGVVHGSSSVSLSICNRLLPVVDLAHLPAILATTCTSGLLLASKLLKKLTNLPTSCYFTVMLSPTSKFSTM